jgi:hypothetical protein
MLLKKIPVVWTVRELGPIEAVGLREALRGSVPNSGVPHGRSVMCG